MDVKHSLLIVEDDYENQKFLSLILKRKFNVDVCDSADSFYTKLRGKKFDAILMDITLKGEKNGLQLTQEIRNMNEYKNIAVVGLSAHAYQKDKDNAYSAGMDLFLTKPISNKNLIDSILKTIELKLSKKTS
jgi:CheY-like chemotaxis protein